MPGAMPRFSKTGIQSFSASIRRQDKAGGLFEPVNEGVSREIADPGRILLYQALASRDEEKKAGLPSSDAQRGEGIG
jgi:hypothetical protein